jgi:hypothetical protein
MNKNSTVITAKRIENNQRLIFPAKPGLWPIRMRQHSRRCAVFMREVIHEWNKKGITPTTNVVVKHATEDEVVT